MSRPHTQAVHSPRIIICATDHVRLMALADAAEKQHPDIADYLINELSRAQVVADGKCAADIIRVGSHVSYRDEASGKTRSITIVYPHEADIARNLVSVLTPIGAALIGLSPGQTISWPSPEGGFGTLQVLEVKNEEAAA